MSADSMFASSLRLVPIDAQLQVGSAWDTVVRDIVAWNLALPHRPNPWGSYLAFAGEQPVGTCAFKSVPLLNQPPEIAYFTFPKFERQGVGRAMARQLVKRAAAERVHAICANTRPEENASTRILHSLGFHRAGQDVDREIGPTWRWSLTLRTQLMGVVNVTPDSFSDGGRFLAAQVAIEHGKALAAAGADILDVGGESTRPGAAEVSVQDELARVLPVIRGLRGVSPELSIDTTKPQVAQAALEAGANLINDVTGLRDSDELARLAARFGARLCVMHMQGTPRTMQNQPQYEDVVSEVVASLQRSVARAVAAGVPLQRVIVDPGIGFGKTFEHNLQLLRGLDRLRELQVPVLVGCSRKTFLGTLTGGKPPPQRDVATAATVAISAAMGTADIVRVHAVAEAKDAAAVGDAIRLAR